MRLGAPVYGELDDPERWIAAVRAAGFSAAYCPLTTPDEGLARDYARAAAAAGVLIAEVGAWSNPISPDAAQRTAALQKCAEKLAIADLIGARCVVNVAGSRSAERPQDPRNLDEGTFDLIVESVRGIIDAAAPRRTYYTLETDPWGFPNTADTYLRLIRAIDRERFAVHLDAVNLVWSPPLYYRNGQLIRECFEKLGPFIKSCHAKDSFLEGKSTAHLTEVRPGLGFLDYPTLLRGLDRLDPDTPLMIEHLPNAEEYALAAQHIRGVAAEIGLRFK
jgi:sugar phosphate isomerase/epimerase